MKQQKFERIVKSNGKGSTITWSWFGFLIVNLFFMSFYQNGRVEFFIYLYILLIGSATSFLIIETDYYFQSRKVYWRKIK